MKREEQIMNDPNLSAYTDKQRGWINEAFMDRVRWADENRPVDTVKTKGLKYFLEDYTLVETTEERV